MDARFDAVRDATSTDGNAPDAAVDAAPDASGDADAGAGEGGDAGTSSPPATLSATGLFTSVAADGSLVLQDGVRLYAPTYELWSDGAEKKRWVYLPPGSKIDNSDQNHWSFPVGSKFWKEFAIAGKRIETRLIERFGPGPDDFRYAAYEWRANDAGMDSDADLLPPLQNVVDAKGTEHNIPFEEHCHRCHDPLKEHVLGFSAIQLTPSPTQPAPVGVTIKTLSDEGWLASPAPAGFLVPGQDQTTQEALGYLHANCGNCHNDTPGIRSPEPRMNLRLLVGQRTVEATGAYTTALNVLVSKPDHRPEPAALRIAGGSPAMSAVSYRTALRGMPNTLLEDQMPPVASEKTDTAGMKIIDDWIRTLPAPPDR